jgi:putative transposase
MTTNPSNYYQYRFPPDIISHAVWLYNRCRICSQTQAPAGPLGRHLAPGRFLRANPAQRQYFWRAVDQDGNIIDILLQSRRDQHAAERFFRKLLKGQGHAPWRLITDKLKSYRAMHRTVMPSVIHTTELYANNRDEVSHQPTQQRERQMREFKSARQAQQFWSIHGVIQNLFRVGRHLLRSANHLILRNRSFQIWKEATCVG